MAGERWQEVEVIGICTVLDELYGKDRFSRQDRPSWKEECEAVKQWVKEHNAHYWSAVKEDFFEWRGQREAHEAGKKLVVVENLS